MDAIVSFVWNYAAFVGSCFIIVCFLALIYLMFFDKPVMGKSANSNDDGGGEDDEDFPELPPDGPSGQESIEQKNNSPRFTRAVIREKIN